MRKSISGKLSQGIYAMPIFIMRDTILMFVEGISEVLWRVRLQNFRRSKKSTLQLCLKEPKRHKRLFEFCLAMADREYEQGQGYIGAVRYLVKAEKLRIGIEIEESERFAREPTLVLDPGWVANVGHTASAAVYIKAKLLNLMCGRDVFIFYSFTANPELIRLLGLHLKVLQVSPKQLSALSTNFSQNFSPFGVFNFPGIGIFGEYEGQNMIESRWSEKNSQGTPVFSKEELKVPSDEYRLIKSSGFEANPFVTFHIRSTSDSTIRTANNVSPDTYNSSIAFLMSLGIRVALLGNDSAPRLKDSIVENPLFWDYAHSKSKHPTIDMFLMSNCIFFVGTASGPIQVPNLFGVPTLYTNQPHIGCNYQLEGFMIPQLLRREDSQKPLSYSEMLQAPLSWSNRETHDNLRRIRNSSDNILNGVNFMYREWLKGATSHDPLAVELQSFQGTRPSMPVEPSFYSEHKYLFTN